MMLAVDVSYRQDAAIVAGVLFSDWTAAEPLNDLVIPCMVPENYIPGHFYRRELPCIAALLEHILEKITCILIDGFVHLGRTEAPGLGIYLYEMLEEKVAVIGVAKTPFKDTPEHCALLRGASKKPLYITSAGMNPAQAKFLIKSMHGRYRIPTLLKYADRLSKRAPPGT